VNPQVYGAQSSLAGMTVGSIYVESVVSVHPLRYSTKCIRCNTSTDISHAAVPSGCRNPACNVLREREELNRQRKAVSMTPDHNCLDQTRLTIPGKVPL
jgi:hypothetical protein